MTDGPQLTIEGADGRSIEAEWVYRDAPQSEWMRDREHWPNPMQPMETYLFATGAAGSDRAWDEVRMVAPPMFHRFQLVGPFLYARETMYSDERMMEIVPRWMEVAAEYGGALNFWKTYCEPRIRRACEEISAMGVDADLAAVSETWHWGFHQTFICLPLLFVPGMALQALFAASSVSDPDMTALEVTQGGANATQDIDAEIWGLAELARATPAVAQRIARDGETLDVLRAEPSARAFLDAFDALIARHGRRAQGWQLTDKTWAEQPDAALALVRAQVTSEAHAPEALRAKSEARKRDAIRRVLDELPPAKHDEFHGLVNALDGYVNIREGRAYWQMVLTGEIRSLVLRIGADLVRRGRIDAPDDVMFLVPDDGLAGAGDLRAVVAERRRQWDGWRTFEPPMVIGARAEVAAEVASMRADLRGAPASRGVVTAVARVIASPEDGHRLQPGEVLVCVQTTPAWTPLFAIAGGVVTETGGPLSHPAITAREYGIPAVLALEGATTRLPDGATITVDGGAGTVSVA